MDIELREELEQIIADLQEYKQQRSEIRKRIEEIDEDINELTESKVPYEDQIEGFDDDIKNAEKAFMTLLREVTDPQENPADYARRALGRM